MSEIGKYPRGRRGTQKVMQPGSIRTRLDIWDHAPERWAPDLTGGQVGPTSDNRASTCSTSVALRAGQLIGSFDRAREPYPHDCSSVSSHYLRNSIGRQNTVNRTKLRVRQGYLIKCEKLNGNLVDTSSCPSLRDVGTKE